MSNATKSRKRVKPERHVTIGETINGVFAMNITVGQSEKAKHFGYYIRSVPADFGLAFHFEKFETEKVEGEPTEYDVLIDLQRGYHSCTCKGNTHCGHCKHVESILALVKSGKIDVPTVKPQTEPTKNETSYETCGFCSGNGWTYASMYDNHGYKRHDEPPCVTCEYCGGSGMVEDGHLLMPAYPREYYER